ncbi:hypothetical protein LWI29_005647 [Acer saccharum]|uniref:Trafficking protein particle complex subunit 5 n=1 Tax=Acer saccharum TaxID=4024 RepID=A0AA39RC36_ACESA|nr:hypothetical protein LWI29_005647 [Acer saccharum]
MIGVGKIKQYSNVLDKPLSKGKQEVSLSAFAFLFSELVQYNQTQVDNIAELERRLEDAGYAVGARVLELLCHREKGNRRETRLLGILSFVHSTVWKVLFGKVADSLEKGTEHEDEYMISEKELLVNRFISIPKDMGTFNCGAFVAGIVRGVLEGAGFPAVVTAHFVPVEGQQRPRTTILIKFAEEVLRREARLVDRLHIILVFMRYNKINHLDDMPRPERIDKDCEEVKAARKKRDEDELICHGHILNALSDRLNDLYTNTKFAKEIWNELHYKYKDAEEGTNKFLISKYFDLKFFDEKPLLSQIHELQIIVNNLRAVKIELPEPFQVGAIIAKLPPSWIGYRKRIFHKSEDYSLEEIQKHLRIEKESRSRDKTIEEFNTGKANAVNKPTNPRGNNHKGKFGNNQKKGNSGNSLGPR